jgi:hypothetical protein
VIESGSKSLVEWSKEVDKIMPDLVQAINNIQNLFPGGIGWKDYEYIPMQAITEEVRRVFAEFHLCVQQFATSRDTKIGKKIKFADNGQQYERAFFYSTIRVETWIIHTSGQYQKSVCEMLSPSDDAYANPTQAEGAGITHVRRYALGAILNIAPDKDKDCDQKNTGETKEPGKIGNTELDTYGIPEGETIVDIFNRYLEKIPGIEQAGWRDRYSKEDKEQVTKELAWYGKFLLELAFIPEGNRRKYKDDYLKAKTDEEREAVGKKLKEFVDMISKGDGKK